MSKILVLTANIGDYDNVPDIPEQTVAFDRVIATEKLWPEESDRYNSLMYKWLHPDIANKYLIWQYDFVIWLDGRIEVTHESTISWLCRMTNRHNAALFRHPDRIDAQEEYQFITDNFPTKWINNAPLWGIDIVSELKSPYGFGLWAGGVICYNMSLMRAGWLSYIRSQIETHELDQLWIPNAIYEFGTSIATINLNLWDNLYIKVHHYHKHESHNENEN